MSPSPPTARYSISADDYVEAFRTYHRITWRRWMLIALAAVLMLVTAALVKELRGVIFGALLGAAVFVVLMRLFLAPWLHRRQYRGYRLIQQEQLLELREDGLYFARDNASGLLAWNDILKWRRGPKMLLLYTGPRLFHMIPCAIAAQDFPLQALEDVLRRRVGEPV